jgi:hypothetical protein
MPRTLSAFAWLSGVTACGDLKGFGGPIPALVTFDVATSALPAGHSFRVALVWGAQWLSEPLCFLPPDPRDDANARVAAVTAGCRDPFGFVPARVAASAPLDPDGRASVPLFTVPSADTLVGDVTSRIAYGSLVVYDDRDGTSTLDFAAPNRPPTDEPMEGPPTSTSDVVYGASFVTMTAPDERIAYREGGFSASAAFYPRAGCSAPPLGFSVETASGFTAEAAIAAAIAGMLPHEQDVGRCRERRASQGPVVIAVDRPDTRSLRELACLEDTVDSSVSYREAGAMAPDLPGRTFACVHVASFGAPSDTVELVVAGRPDDACAGLTHYILRGCSEGPDCQLPEWDHSASPPAWWPC